MHSFHGAGGKHSFFEDWYLKQQNETETVALIPAFHTNEIGVSSASLQIICGSEAFWIPYPAEEFHTEKRQFLVRLGHSVFCGRGCRLNVHTEGCRLEGALSFGPFAPPRGDVMGPFRFAPVLQCRHSVFSLYHRVNGTLTLNGRKILFRNGNGYCEKDRGPPSPHGMSGRSAAGTAAA